MPQINSVSSSSQSNTKVLGESPAIPMSGLYERLRGTLPTIPGLEPQSSSRDAVTISPEAQAAADHLKPAD